MPTTTVLPGPYTVQWDWRLEGACRDESSDTFYHPEGERGRARMMRERRAKEICQTCPVLKACREHALSTGEVYGIWGGMTEGERQRYLRSVRIEQR
ncbi:MULTISPECIES: WhiB family transcriptional regulator [Corynebacterium]|uniref:Transcriptional regulator WhiB n=2 Tax=Corynebacterium TaxID=1716 RepID=A0A3G6IW94_9CORY|nr:MULTISPECIES: WhiB family transcriptional regulator [Corynebacterium]AZA09926.1 putative transcriptional regulator WhiB3 [Corynebacterium pseudopelargi]QAU53036.1 putative transcriptional regulator WhiB3 [Corynebacterium pelargi]GGG75303.1 transcriptional regulator WhiB [Corynebacterium pelargi]